MLRATAFLAFFHLLNGQVNGCNFTHVAETVPLNYTRLDGKWNVVSSVSAPFGRGSCATVTFNDTAGTLNILELVDGVESNQVGNYNASVGSNDTARFTATFSGSSFELFVVGTNYDGYALIYHCELISANTTSVWAWVLSRTTALSAADKNTVDGITSSHPDLANLTFAATDHSEKTCNGSSPLQISSLLFALVFALRNLMEA